MKKSVKLIQTEKWYHVDYKGKEYAVTVYNDHNNDSKRTEIFDDDGTEITNEKLRLNIRMLVEVEG